MANNKMSSLKWILAIYFILVSVFAVYIYDNISQLLFFYVVLLILSGFFVCMVSNMNISDASARINEERLRVTLSHIKKNMFDNVLEADITNNIPFGTNTRKLAALLGVPLTATYDDVIEVIAAKLVHPDFAEEYRQILCKDNVLKTFNQGKSFIEYECIERSDGINYRWIRVHMCIFKSEVSDTLRVISFVKNIDEEKKALAELTAKAQRDLLTGLYNKVSVQEKIDTCLAELPLYTNYAFIMFDLDDFKNINDTYGHDVGDNVLKVIAAKLKVLFVNNAIIGRLGGDEFVVLVTKADRDWIVDKIEMLGADMAAYVNSSGYKIPLAFSIGIVYQDAIEDFAALYKKSDIALYRSKRSGKKQYMFYQ